MYKQNQRGYNRTMYVKCNNSLMTSCNSATHDENTNILPRLKKEQITAILFTHDFPRKDERNMKDNASLRRAELKGARDPPSSSSL